MKNSNIKQWWRTVLHNDNMVEDRPSQLQQILGLMLSLIFALGLIFTPFYRAMAAPTYVPGHYNNDGTYTFGDFVWNNSGSITENPVPLIKSINPKSSNVGVGVKTVTIYGSGFVPNSIARVNASNRSTTFIDSSHLLMQITGDDTSAYETSGGFYITVFNNAPGGGYSNAAFFSIGAGIQTKNGTVNDNNFNSLASNAIFGSDGFMPSGLMQWILFAIVILLIVILARKVSSARKNYEEKAMKHD